MKVTTFGEVVPEALTQLETCVNSAEWREGKELPAVLCGDHHVGYSQPIGGVVAYTEHISPSGVGYDIACGNLAAKLNVRARDLNISKVMDEVFKRISFGVGRFNDVPVDHQVLADIEQAEFRAQRRMIDLAAKQLGTVGSGNHYVDIFSDEEGYTWIGVHFGSRGFGHKTASGFLAMAQGGNFTDRGIEGEMYAPPTLFHTKSEIGQAYIEAMNLAGKYAYAGRETVVDIVAREILKARIVETVHNHHNFAWRETHPDPISGAPTDYWVIRKGATPAGPGVRGFVGGSMGDISVILEGVESPRSASALYSTVHGAGRVMSRRAALGKFKDGEWKIQPRIDWDAAIEDLNRKGIVLRGGGADEAPGVYRNLSDVLASHEGTIKVQHVLSPLGVAMAPKGVFDPYKD